MEDGDEADVDDHNYLSPREGGREKERDEKRRLNELGKEFKIAST